MIDAKTVHARDLMRTRVLGLETGMPIEEAIRRLAEARVGGAPVVDAAGRLVGMLTLSDITNPEHEPSPRVSSAGAALESVGDEDAELESDIEGYSAAATPGDTVADWMSPEVISVRPDSTLKHICTTLAEQGIHRVVVVDRQKLVGIISTSDVVRWVAENS